MEKARNVLVKMLKRHLKTVEPGAGKLLYKEPSSKYFRLWAILSLLKLLNTAIVAKSSHNQYVKG